MDRKPNINIEEQHFDKIREQNSFYLDKTEFIKAWWETGSSVSLITRPKGFGKTLNMSMLKCFFSNEYAGRSDLFEGLSIWKDEKYRQLQGTYPVIFLSFANIKTANYEEMEYQITERIAKLYEQHSYLLEGDLLNPNEKKYYATIRPGMDSVTVSGALNLMTDFLRCCYGKDVIILLDEYDTPLQEAWLSGYWDQAAMFLEELLISTFKANRNLYRGIITGITRTPKGSIFSGLNNLDVITTTSKEFATYFGFTEDEVFRVLDETGLGSEKQHVREWYGGFTFGQYTDIYNPWSILSFIKKNGEYSIYRSDTDESRLINSLIQGGNSSIKQTMEELLQDKSFDAEIDEEIVLDQLDGSSDAVWSMLLAAGYLKVEKIERVGKFLKKVYTLRLTNTEVKNIFFDMIKSWFGGNIETAYNEFIKALLMGDLDSMNEFINQVALHSFSSFDTAKGIPDDNAPERFYHGFVLGLMVELAGRYTITSNQESGFGRYDVMLVPSDREKDFSYIIEFKVHKPKKEKDLAQTVENALQQIEEKHYSSALEAKGIAPDRIRKYGFAFEGKKCLIGQ